MTTDPLCAVSPLEQHDAPLLSRQAESGRLHPRNTLNDMTGERFLYFTKSVLTTAYPSVFSHKLRKKHGANKPPQLMALLIEFFTKAGMTVLDPFAGVGGTLIGASIALPGPRSCIGIEISPEWTDVYGHVLAENCTLLPQPMVQGNCLDVMDAWLAGQTTQAMDGRTIVGGHDMVDFIAMDPPYNVHMAQTMSGQGGRRYADTHANRRSDYNMRSDQEHDFANLASYDDYLAAMTEVFSRCICLLRPGRYMAIIVRNAYQNGSYMFTHVDLARRAQAAGFVPKGEIIWYQAGTKLRPYGYPHSYVPNIAHQYIVVFQRPRPRAPSSHRKKSHSVSI